MTFHKKPQSNKILVKYVTILLSLLKILLKKQGTRFLVCLLFFLAVTSPDSNTAEDISYRFCAE